MASDSTTTVSGILELNPRGQGSLRDPARNLRIQAGDPVVEAQLVARYRLLPGASVTGVLEPGEGPGRRLAEVTSVEGVPAEQAPRRPEFEDLTPIDPRERLRLETGPEPLGPRVMELFTPVGKGQRGLIVAPPRSGKTILLQQLANAISRNHPEVHLFVLLIDERPEEVTEMRRSIQGQVFASSNDQEIEQHLRLAQLGFDRGRRIAEAGGHALILLDSLTRLARAYNKNSSSGRTMTGGVDIKALDVPKRLFGSARAFDEGGSLTVLATCLVETGSRMDDLIFQEFKGTGNMELVLDRKLAERRVWPAIDLAASGTRKEERLLDPSTLRQVSLLRRTLADLKPLEAMEALVQQLAASETNAAFLERVGQATRGR